MELLMGRLLQAGVLLASSVVLVGGVLYLRAHGSIVANYHQFHGEPQRLREFRQLASGIAHGRPSALIQLGVLILIATPVARVVLAAVAFALERDRLYIAVSLTVLAVLILGLFHIA